MAQRPTNITVFKKRISLLGAIFRISLYRSINEKIVKSLSGSYFSYADDTEILRGYKSQYGLSFVPMQISARITKT